MAKEDENSDDLRKFVAEECEAQAAESASDFTNPPVGVERMNAFYERALNESERMSNEVTKSHIQRRELHKELGAGLFEDWTHDHAKQVLSNQRYELWSKEEEKSKIAMQKLQDKTIHEDDDSEDAEK